MPLVLMCGYPCSGKSRRAQELALALQAQGHTVHLVGEEGLGVERGVAYANSTAEKQVRGGIKSAVDRLLRGNTCVIVDSLNYIKGYRYELYCIARSMKTSSCVIQTVVRDEQCLEWHRERGSLYGSDEAVRALILRFEAPDGHNRWDKPLFSLTVEDPFPIESVLAALFETKAPAPHYSTQTQPLAETNLLHELDRVTNAIVAVGAASATAGDSDLTPLRRPLSPFSPLPHTSESGPQCLGAAWRLAGGAGHQTQGSSPPKADAPGAEAHATSGEAGRTLPPLRRGWTLCSACAAGPLQFLTYAKTHPPKDVESIAALFVDFVNRGQR
jgi:protein KTI12